MSVLFDDASSQYLQYSGAVVTAVPLTIWAWFRTDDLTADQYILNISDTSVADQQFGMYAAGSVANDPLRAVTYDTTLRNSSKDGVQNITWHHGAAVIASSTSRIAYLDGTAGTEETTSATPSGLDATAIGRACDSTPGYYMSGRIAEVAVWSIALTAAEVARGAAGESPLTIQPQSLVSYWQLKDDLKDVIGGYDMTAYASPTFDANHPPIPDAVHLRRLLWERWGRV